MFFLKLPGVPPLPLLVLLLAEVAHTDVGHEGDEHLGVGGQQEQVQQVQVRGDRKGGVKVRSVCRLWAPGNA